MNRKNFIILLIFVLSLLFSCCWGPKEKADSEIFTSIEPMEWSEDYVFSATNSPSSIQIWDSKTNKLVKDISLVIGKRCITIVDMAVLEKSVWLIGYGISYNLIRIDIETGKVEYINFSYDGYRSRPYRIQAISKEEDGVGTLWVKSYGNAKNGTLFACYNVDGTLRDCFPIETDIENTPMSAVYHNNKYYLLGTSLSDVLVGNQEQESYSLINLSDKTVIKLKNTVFFDKEFFENEYEGINIKKFISNAMIYDKDILSLNIVTGYISENERRIVDKCLYKIKSYSPFEAEYLGMKFENNSIIDIFQNDNFYYVLLSSYENPENKNGFGLLEIDKNNKNVSKFVIIPHANSYYIAHQKIETKEYSWISINKYKDSENDSIIQEICKLDHETGRVFVYSEVGTERELSYTDVSE